jgi:signal transduction histidine kinase/CheY-like chemotaxis protein
VKGETVEDSRDKQYPELMAALRERERQLEDAMSAGRVVPWEWNIQEDVVVRALDSVLFGPTSANLEQFLAHVHADDRHLVRAALAETLDKDAPYAVTYRRQVGTELRWFEARASLTRDASGKPHKLVGVVVEITDRKELEHRLAQSSKLEALGLLAGGIAHDFNNILTAIIGSAHLLKSQSAPELIDAILEASQRGASLTKQLLAFGRRQVVTRTSVDLGSAVEEVLAFTQRTLGEDIEVEVTPAPSSLYVIGDSTQLSQVLLNLVLNARDAMPTGGVLRIRISPVVLDRAQAHSLGLSPGEYAHLQVADTGVGMDAATQARIFEPFFTTKSLGRGTGLGLSVVYGVVTQSGGAVVVDSAPNMGTRFNIYLPRTTTPPNAAGVSSASVARTESASILLVEDDESVRRVARTVLESAGHRVTDAATGRLGLAAAQIAEKPFDLVLTDVVMPGMGGMALVQELRARAPNLRVLFMSGYASDDTFRHGISESEVRLLHKPFRPDELLAIVSDVLGRPAR